MNNLPDVSTWVKSLIPDLDGRIEQFRVDTDYLDDELFDAFKQEILDQAVRMNTGIASNSMEDIRLAAHSIKGMGGTMGLPEISVLADEIERRIKSDDLSGCESLTREFLAWTAEFFGA